MCSVLTCIGCDSPTHRTSSSVWWVECLPPELKPSCTSRTEVRGTATRRQSFSHFICSARDSVHDDCQKVVYLLWMELQLISHPIVINKEIAHVIQTSRVQNNEISTDGTEQWSAGVVMCQLWIKKKFSRTQKDTCTRNLYYRHGFLLTCFCITGHRKVTHYHIVLFSLLGISDTVNLQISLLKYHNLKHWAPPTPSILFLL